MPLTPGILARGRWAPEQVDAAWLASTYEPPERATGAADSAISALRERGSPAHDGLSGRLVAFDGTPERLHLELEPARWALRLDPFDAARSVAAMCVVRAGDGRWLAGRMRAGSPPGRGAGRSARAGPWRSAKTRRTRSSASFFEEWSVTAERMTVEALVCLPQQLVMVLGVALLADGAQVVPDEEHDEFAWWPAEVADWPAEADEPLRAMATMLATP